MPILVVAEHDDLSLKSATLNTVTAAAALRADDVHVLVAGSNCTAAAAAAATPRSKRSRPAPTCRCRGSSGVN